MSQPYQPYQARASGNVGIPQTGVNTNVNAQLAGSGNYGVRAPTYTSGSGYPATNMNNYGPNRNTASYQNQPFSNNPNTYQTNNSPSGLRANAGASAGTSGYNANARSNPESHSLRNPNNPMAAMDEIYDQLDKNQQKELNVAAGSQIFCLFFGFLILNAAFIIPDLIYANQNSECVTREVDGIAFPLKTWLMVDAYTRIAMSAIILIFAILACVSFKNVVHLIPCVFLLILIYSLFLLAWLIVGSIMFFGKLNPQGACTGGVQTYMYVFLILNYVALCCNAFCGKAGGI